MALTQKDIDNSGKFAEANNKIRLLRAVHKKVPHLASHLKYTVRAATDDDYYVPQALQASSKVVEVEITEKLCKLLSCNPATEKDMCTPEMKASYYYVGDDGWDIQCQPACFNTAAKQTFDDDTGLRSPDTPMLNFHDGKCRLVNSSMISYLEKTYYRSSTHYENRLNDMPTGFSRYVDTENPYGSGWQYKTNPTYCRYYDRHYESDGSCEMTFWEKVLDSFIGMSLINTVRSSIRMITNDGKPFDLPTDLPSLPAQIPAEFASVEQWRANVDDSFVVPDLIDTTPNRDVLRTGSAAKTTTTTTNRRSKRNVADSTTKTTTTMTRNGDYDDDNDDRHEFRRLKERQEAIYDKNDDEASPFMRQRCGLPPSSSRKRNKRATETNKEGSVGGAKEDETWLEKIADILKALLKSAATDPDFWLGVGVGVGSEVALDTVKALCKRIVEKLSVYATGEMLKIGSAVGAKILGGALRGIAVRMVTSVVIRVGSKLAIMLAKITAAAASVIGWLLVGAMLLDLLFTFWDPYGYNNLFPPEMPKVLNDNGQLAFRKALESATCNYEFESFVGLVLTQDEILAIQIESFTDRLTYLDSLVVNSEGSRIDKGEEISMGDDQRTSDMEAARNRAMTDRVKRFDPESYAAYNRDFFARTRVNEWSNWAAGACCVVALGFGLLGLYLLAVFFLLLTLLILTAARLELQGDLAVETIRELKFAKVDADTALTGKTSSSSLSSSYEWRSVSDESRRIFSGVAGTASIF